MNSMFIKNSVGSLTDFHCISYYRRNKQMKYIHIYMLIFLSVQTVSQVSVLLLYFIKN